MPMSFDKNKGETTLFSEFIRNASAGEKKRVYKDVLKKATERQLKVIEEARALEKEHTSK